MAGYDVFNKLSELLAQYGWTAEEALENLDKATKALANYYIMGSDAVKDVISDINNLIVDLRPETDAETENPNQKSDLEIFEWNGINTSDKIFILEDSDDEDWIKEALNGDIEI